MGNLWCKTIDKYQITDKIGIGSMLFAINTNNGSNVVIKVDCSFNFTLDADKINSLKTIRHQNILTPLDIIVEHPYVYFVYEQCKSETLADYVNKRGGLTEDEVRQITRQILAAYQELIKNKVIHRNIKPQNILLVQEDQLTIKLCDFGMTKKSSFNNEFYTAPEIITGTEEPNHLSDIWSIGAVIYFMTNGKPQEILKKDKKSNNYLIKPGISYYCMDFMMKCLRYEASIRPIYKEVIKVYNETRECKEITKFMADYAYVCYCDRRQDVILCCGHSYCVNCIAQMKWNSILSKQETESLIKQLDDNIFIIIKCSKCLAYYEIDRINLHCRCVLRKGDRIYDVETRYNSSAKNRVICHKHKDILTFTEQWLISNEIHYSFGKINTNSGTVLSTIFEENKIVTTLELKWKNLNNNYVDEIEKALKDNTTLTTLKLDNNRIGDEGAKAIAKALKDNNTLTTLYLNDNVINFEGAKAITMMLKDNTTLTTLKLDNNMIGYKGAMAIAIALKHNNTLTNISLGCNEIGLECADGAKAIAIALQINNTLTTLDISNNNIGYEGAKVIIMTLKDNITLTDINLNSNNIGCEGAKSIVTALKDNNTLTTLYLNNNSIGDEGAKAIITALKDNKTLTKLSLSKNKITEGSVKAIETILEYNTKLTDLDLSDNSIGNEGAIVIAEAIVNNKVLIRLSLSANNVRIPSKDEIRRKLRQNNRLISFLL